jgi:TonB family protein
MHNVAFGSPENLGGVLLSLHEDRHFAMDFWSVVNALSSQEINAPGDEEMLETVIESATGKESAALPEYERPGVTELRLMLAGVDTSRPAELPDAIHRPNDALLQPLPPPASTDAGASGAKSAQVSRRSIGDALAKLEQTSRELREQLVALEGSAVQEDLPFVAAASEAKTDAPLSAERTISEPAIEVERSVPARAPEVPPAPAPRQAPPVVTSPVVERVERPQPRYVEPAPVPVAAVERPAAIPPAPKPVQPVASAGAEVFARKPISELSRRGLTLPDPDDDPSIVAPLSNYAQDRSGARYAIAVVVILAVATSGFFAARTEKGHSMLSSAGASVQSMYAKAKDALGASKETAQVETPPKPSAAAESAPVTSPAAAPAATQATPAQTTPAPGAPAPAQTTPPTPSGADTSTTSAVSTPQLQPQKSAVEAKPPVVAPKPVVAPPPIKNTKNEPVAKSTKKQRDEEAIAEAAAAKTLARQRAEEAASASLERVPASIMARNLIASRVPAYPEPARTQRIEGPVELEVVVTPDGFVKYAHAIDGDRHLRGAAEDAVSRWRYRPYIENGSAVEIVTTVRVDFRLPQ